MNTQIGLATSILACLFLVGASCSLALAQQKPPWMPGQVGLNAGILPSPGFTYVNLDENYDAGAFNGPKGNAIPVTGNYNVWAIENLFYFVPDTKFLGGNLGFDIIFPTPATGSLVADINVQGWESITQRSFCPLPCSTRKTVRWLSIAGSVRATASEMRRPAA